ncbi:MAG: helix-turn-helix transcriptional regulator [Cyanothece sp. SIO1E1]|nr:helix-turn-helix transcriptional regulator [Cyanothece sp. SIO1E1]
MIKPTNFTIEEGQSPLKRIRELMGGISQEELARRIGVSAQTVSRWERGLWAATLTLPQAKALDRELTSIGLTLQDLPDTFGPLSKPF